MNAVLKSFIVLSLSVVIAIYILGWLIDTGYMDYWMSSPFRHIIWIFVIIWVYKIIKNKHD